MYLNNKEYIEKHNEEAKRGLHTYTLGMNEYGDMVKLIKMPFSKLLYHKILLLVFSQHSQKY